MPSSALQTPRLAIGLSVLLANAFTNLARRPFRTRIEPGNRGSGHGVLAYCHQHPRGELQREVAEPDRPPRLDAT